MLARRKIFVDTLGGVVRVYRGSKELRDAMSKGIRFIDGQEYLLAGRCSSKQSAISEAIELRRFHSKVRIIKVWEFDYLVYVHG